MEISSKADLQNSKNERGIRHNTEDENLYICEMDARNGEMYQIQKANTSGVEAVARGTKDIVSIDNIYIYIYILHSIMKRREMCTTF